MPLVEQLVGLVWKSCTSLLVISEFSMLPLLVFLDKIYSLMHNFDFYKRIILKWMGCYRIEPAPSIGDADWIDRRLTWLYFLLTAMKGFYWRHQRQCCCFFYTQWFFLRKWKIGSFQILIALSIFTYNTLLWQYFLGSQLVHWHDSEIFH